MSADKKPARMPKYPRSVHVSERIPEISAERLAFLANHPGDGFANSVIWWDELRAMAREIQRRRAVWGGPQ